MVPKTPDSKIGVVGSTSPPEKGLSSQKTWVFISLHRLQTSLLQNPSNFGATASHWLLYFLLFFFFLIFNRMDAWSLMRGNAFIHFVSGSRRVNIRLGVLLLIPKSPQYKKKGELWEGNFSNRRLSVNHSGISDKYSQNQHNTIWRFNNKIYNNINNLIWENKNKKKALRTKGDGKLTLLFIHKIRDETQLKQICKVDT